MLAMAHNAHVMAAATTYANTGDHGVWKRCFDALLADCERLDAATAKYGAPAMAHLVGAWPDGAPERSAMTDAQAVALVRAAEARRAAFDAACRCAETSARAVMGDW